MPDLRSELATKVKPALSQLTAPPPALDDLSFDDEDEGKRAPLQMVRSTPPATTTPAPTPMNMPPNLDENRQLSVGETFFHVVRLNPGLTRKQLTAQAKAVGVRPGSASAYFVQLARRGLLRAETSPEGQQIFYAIGDKFRGESSRIERPSRAKRAKKDTALSTALKAHATPAPVAPVVAAAAPATEDLSPTALLTRLNVHQARELYLALRNIFTA